MNGLARYVSRKVAATIAVFAVFALFAAGAAAFAVAGGRADAGSVGLSASLSDPAALEAALDDPGSAVGGSAADEPAADAGPDGSSGWQQLRADLRAARALTGDARRSALADIRAKAQDGGYGEAVERRADRHQVRHDLLFSLLPDDLQRDLTALRNAPADQRRELRSNIVDKALAGDYGPEVQKAAEQLRSLHRA